MTVQSVDSLRLAGQASFRLPTLCLAMTKTNSTGGGLRRDVTVSPSDACP